MFDYICFHKTDEGNVIDEFTLFAKIIYHTDSEVTFKRYQNFGKIEWEKLITVPICEFEKYFIVITDEIYNNINVAKLELITKNVYYMDSK